MKLGLGLYRHMLTPENFAFARQCGCTHVVAHLVDYFNQGKDNERDNQPTGGEGGWGRAGDPDKLWTYDDLASLKSRINAAGLELAAIENLDPAHWYDVLLDGPRKAEQLENVKALIRDMGKAGIPVLGYNFSIAGVAGRSKGRYARGGAESVGMEAVDQTPIPNGMVWNMVYNPDAPAGTVPKATPEELWRRLKGFLDAVVPVAEGAGVTLAAHPDDPPVPVLRSQPRLVYQPRLYQKLLDLRPSPRNALEFCIGSLAEMTEGDIYEVIDNYSRQQKVAYVHFRNVHGKAPHYHEMFVDDGDVDMRRAMNILKRNGFGGVLVPDHTPQMKCGAPWHAGMAFALGYMRAILQQAERDA
ncbi:MAG: mannonate dehydratase [Acidobacteriota bacterium]|nr:mannonate dehydratase [Acidobacteriota bacterium]